MRRSPSRNSAQQGRLARERLAAGRNTTDEDFEATRAARLGKARAALNAALIRLARAEQQRRQARKKGGTVTHY